MKISLVSFAITASLKLTDIKSFQILTDIKSFQILAEIKCYLSADCNYSDDYYHQMILLFDSNFLELESDVMVGLWLPNNCNGK